MKPHILTRHLSPRVPHSTNSRTASVAPEMFPECTDMHFCLSINIANWNLLVLFMLYYNGGWGDELFKYHLNLMTIYCLF